MFEPIEDQIKIDEQKATTSRQRAIRSALIMVLSLVFVRRAVFRDHFLRGKLAGANTRQANP